MAQEVATVLVVLIVEDSNEHRRFLAEACKSRSHETIEASCCEEVLALPESPSIDAALIDVVLPDGAGLRLIGPLLERNPSMAIVVQTGYPAVAGAVYAMQLGARDYLPKPVRPDTLLDAISGKACEPENVSGPARTLEQAEWDFINEVLGQCGGNVSEAARRLGIHRQSLQRKLRKPPG